MTGKITITACLAAVALLAGCSEAVPGTSRELGAVGYADAFVAAARTMAQYFSLASVDQATGTIVAKPRPIKPERDSLLTTAPARQLASMQLRRENGQVMAYLAVAVQQQQSPLHRQFAESMENYDGSPNIVSPADLDAATTARQNEVWETLRYDSAAEARILAQLYRTLHPQATE